MAETTLTNKERGGEQGIKVPKGTRDIDPYQAAVRETVIEKLVSIFKRHGAVTIETPVFELRDTLTGKYGEDSKLIYDLADQGGEICSLRYDLTVPFARYLAMNRIEKMKRYHIAKVYRRDSPMMSKGRFREFYQCDFDVAGVYESMIPDAECVGMMINIYKDIEVGAFCVKLNHRKLLDGIFEICNVPADKFRAICSAVDKLDKETWETVRKEMVVTKGLDEASADKIGEFVRIKGEPWTILNFLKADPRYEQSESAMTALREMESLFQYLDYFQVDFSCLSFDLSLARGLDYYTGLIYEVVLTDTDRVGSIGGGGRYDNLVGMYGKKQVPCVGFSVGIERIFGILEENARANKSVRESPTHVVVASVGKDMTQHRLRLASELWNANINCEFLYKKDPNMKQQLDLANDRNIPLACIIGEDEINQQKVKVKDLISAEQVMVDRADIVTYIKQKLNLDSTSKSHENSANFGVPTGFSSLSEFNDFMADKSFVNGYVISKDDVRAFEQLHSVPSEKYPHAARFYRQILSLSEREKRRLSSS